MKWLSKLFRNSIKVAERNSHTKELQVLGHTTCWSSESTQTSCDGLASCWWMDVWWWEECLCFSLHCWLVARLTISHFSLAVPLILKFVFLIIFPHLLVYHWSTSNSIQKLCSSVYKIHEIWRAKQGTIVAVSNNHLAWKMPEQIFMMKIFCVMTWLSHKHKPSSSILNLNL